MTPEREQAIRDYCKAACNTVAPDVRACDTSELLFELDRLRARLGEVEKQLTDALKSRRHLQGIINAVNKATGRDQNTDSTVQAVESIVAQLAEARAAAGAMRAWIEDNRDMKQHQWTDAERSECEALLRSDIGAREAAWKKAAKRLIESSRENPLQDSELFDRMRRALLDDRIAADGSIEPEPNP